MVQEGSRDFLGSTHPPTGRKGCSQLFSSEERGTIVMPNASNLAALFLWDSELTNVPFNIKEKEEPCVLLWLDSSQRWGSHGQIPCSCLFFCALLPFCLTQQPGGGTGFKGFPDPPPSPLLSPSHSTGMAALSIAGCLAQGQCAECAGHHLGHH